MMQHTEYASAISTDAISEFEGGDRTRVFTDDTSLVDNGLRFRVERLAAVGGH